MKIDVFHNKKWILLSTKDVIEKYKSIAIFKILVAFKVLTVL